MRHLLAINFLAALFLFQQPVTAQNNQENTSGLQNTTWKSYIAEPLNDTMVIRFATDSSYFESKSGEKMVTSSFTVSGDTIVVTDASGEYACLGQSGKYKYTITADELKFNVIEDPCEGRSATITASTWQLFK